MKNRSHYTLPIFTIFAVLFVSCQKEEETAAATMKLHATIVDKYTPGENGSKVVVDGLKPKFISDDKIWVNGKEFVADVSEEGSVEFDGAEVTPTYYAVYPYDLVPESTPSSFPMIINLPARQTYESITSDGKQIQKIKAPMAAYSTTDNLSFQNVCALLKVRVRNNVGMGDFHLDSIRITCDKAIAGTGTINYDDAEGVFSLTASGKYSVTLIGINENVLENKSSMDYYIYIPPVTGGQFTITSYGVFTNKTIAEFKVAKTTTANISKNTLAATSQLLKTSDHRYTRPFSVAAGKQVYFSPGNLQWSYNSGATHAVNGGGTSAGTWRFAEEQWISYTNTTVEGGNTLSQDAAETTDNWLDLFGWGTSGWSGCGNTYYMPYDRIRAGGTGNQQGYGPRNQSSGTLSLLDAYSNSDWGVYNAIVNGIIIDPAGTWRTLTKEEWLYLLTNNLNTAAIVNGVTGYMFLPDNWELPDDIPMVYSTTTAATNTYDLDQWSKLESNGAVFLPATGFRNNNSVTVDNYCYYWTSTSGLNPKWAYRFYFKPSNSVKVDGDVSSSMRYLGYAVRLISDIEQ